jgi:glucosamine 6-phosphate synthetase-like amidotransferase/phosphosugar isomerase protein
MCGVIGLVYQQERDDLGQIASELLKTLEYRGYDSTGGAFQGDGMDVRLLKGVGAPSQMVHQLGITRMGGRAFCGQVRWATFGAVTDENSQPHVVRCKSFLYGAHNGNVTNCDDLKAWLTAEGHDVLSDNDGEMVVHTVEHFFARELGMLTGPATADSRHCAMRRALLSAARKLEGSSAASSRCSSAVRRLPARSGRQRTSATSPGGSTPCATSTTTSGCEGCSTTWPTHRRSARW